MQHQLRQELQRHFAFQLVIAGQPDHAHSAATENPHERIAPKNLLAGAESRTSSRGQARPGWNCSSVLPNKWFPGGQAIFLPTGPLPAPPPGAISKLFLPGSICHDPGPMVICGHCQSQNSPYAQSCLKCGAILKARRDPTGHRQEEECCQCSRRGNHCRSSARSSAAIEEEPERGHSPGQNRDSPGQSTARRAAKTRNWSCARGRHRCRAVDR